MKNFTLIAFLILTIHSIFAQYCNPGKSTIDLNINNISATFRVGDMFNDDNDPGYFVNVKEPVVKVSSLFATTLWMSGISANQEIKVSKETYWYGTQSCYKPYGNNQNDCENWDRFWKINKEDIKAHIADWEDNHIIDNKFSTIYSWPANANPYFETQNGFSLPTDVDNLASFYDQNNDKIYNPDDGDYPILSDPKSGKQFIPDQMIWYMLNDHGLLNDISPLNMIIQVTAWAFDSPDNLLNNTIFTKHTMIYKGDKSISNFKSAIWSDMDLGCPNDDYIGCSKDLSSFFVYNADSIDGSNGSSCSGKSTFGNDPGVQVITFLSDSLNSFIYYSNNIGIPGEEPNYVVENYRLMNSKFKDGTHLKYGGNGYNTGIDTDYAFDGNPNDTSQWSMKSANLPLQDVRGLGTIYFGELNPGETKSFTTAYTYFNNPDVKSTASDLDSMYTGIKRLHTIYNNFFDENTNSTSEYNNAAIKISPNPAKDYLKIYCEKLNSYIVTIYDVFGRTLKTIKSNTNECIIDISGVGSGTYIIQLAHDGLRISRKEIIIK